MNHRLWTLIMHLCYINMFGIGWRNHKTYYNAYNEAYVPYRNDIFCFFLYWWVPHEVISSFSVTQIFHPVFHPTKHSKFDCHEHNHTNTYTHAKSHVFHRRRARALLLCMCEKTVRARNGVYFYRTPRAHCGQHRRIVRSFVLCLLSKRWSFHILST